MLVRTIAAAVLLPVFLALVFLAPLWATAAMLCILCGLAAYELLWATGMTRNRGILALAVLFAAGVPWWLYFGAEASIFLLAFSLYAFALFCIALCRHESVKSQQVFAALFGGAVLPAALSLLLWILQDEHGKYMVLMPCIAAWMSDTCAYFGGTFFGRHKLAPAISPKKTVEGSVIGILGACIFQLIYAFILMRGFSLSVNIPAIIAFGLIGAAAGQIGDLSLSLIKRECGIKDYGRLMPGHGGVLDRFDSLIFILPFFYAVHAFFGMIH